ncbi:MAG: hypothetical protein AAB706_02425 [Patescibacteria group bacterium]
MKSGRPKGSINRPVWLTARQAYYLYSFLDDFSSEFNKYAKGQGTTIMIALKRIIPDDLEMGII